MVARRPAVAVALLLAAMAHWADGHAFLSEPLSRNMIAYQQQKMYCPHCMQAGGPNVVKGRGGGTWPSKDAPESHGLCGDPVQGEAFKENWREETYLQPTAPQRVYTAGSVVEFKIGVSTHHRGHYEFRICNKALSPDTIATREEGQACLDTWLLERAPPRADCLVNDADADCQPIDPEQPHRWYLPPQGGNVQGAGPDWSDSDASPHPSVGEVHTMRYKIPLGLNCSHCTLQWYWSTGNTCLYDAGYFSYFDKMKLAGWSSLSWCNFCTPGATCQGTCCGADSGKFAEEFWNCADIAVTGDGIAPPTPPTVSPMPTPTPAVGMPTPSADCATVWGQCGGMNWVGPVCCAPGNFCFEQNEWYSQCQPGSGPPAPTPTPSPEPVQPATTPAPSPEPVQPSPSPPSGPQACLDLCPKAEQPSCGALSSSRSSCESSYYMNSGLAMPCRWTECGCVADGDDLLECPDLATLCTGGPTPPPACDSFCRKESLDQRFVNWTVHLEAAATLCFYYKHRPDLCGASYIRAADGRLVPCMYSEASVDCIANHVAAKDCSGFSCNEQGGDADPMSLVVRRLKGAARAEQKLRHSPTSESARAELPLRRFGSTSQEDTETSQPLPVSGPD